MRSDDYMVDNDPEPPYGCMLGLFLILLTASLVSSLIWYLSR